MSAKLAPVALEDKRDVERFTCDVPTTVQPPSAFIKDPWPATIRDISNGGLCLTLARRFERGSGLAIELPIEGGTTATILARVVHVRAYSEGGWLLGVDFISELSDEEVQLVLNLDPLTSATLCTESYQGIAPASINGVLFQARVRRGEMLRWYVKRLDLAGGWPLKVGKVVSMSVGGLPPGTPPLAMNVRDCRRFGSYWLVEGKLTTEPSDELMHALMTAPTMGRAR